LNKDQYDEVVLVGFSLGGNLLLKYLGERETLPKVLKKAVAITSPQNLNGSLESLGHFYNWVYRTSFLFDLKKKYKVKMRQYPEKMKASDLKKIKTLLDFDTIYTAPAHGFKDAFDYYEKNSAKQFLPNVKIPVLLLNAQNDTFLSLDCYPVALASESKYLYLETPKYGGHVGYFGTNKLFYSEQRTNDFLNGH
jgi:predicted alpha/beta-fold hydrolase